MSYLSFSVCVNATCVLFSRPSFVTAAPHLWAFSSQPHYFFMPTRDPLLALFSGADPRISHGFAGERNERRLRDCEGEEKAIFLYLFSREKAIDERGWTDVERRKEISLPLNVIIVLRPRCPGPPSSQGPFSPPPSRLCST